MIYNFYEVNLEVPLSRSLKSQDFESTKLGKLSEKSDGNIKLVKIHPKDASSAKYGWRVVDAFHSQEDSTMTHFRAYGLNGESLSQSAFGVWFGSSEDSIDTRMFDYEPKRGEQYYIPVANNFHTQHSGGYEVQVLDTKYPSETLEFGMYKFGDKHEALVISFRLFELDENYPEI